MLANMGILGSKQKMLLTTVVMTITAIGLFWIIAPALVLGRFPGFWGCLVMAWDVFYLIYGFGYLSRFEVREIDPESQRILGNTVDLLRMVNAQIEEDRKAQNKNIADHTMARE